MRALDLTGNKYGELVAIRLAPREQYKERSWVCICSCGKETVVKTGPLRSGHTRSCGHLIREWVRNQPRGKDAYNWKGGRRIDEGGYVLIYKPGHPKSKGNGYVKEHTLVMESKIGRSLLPEENVHHIDGDKTNNSPENLELWSTMQPSGQRVEDKVAWARKIIELYG